MPAQNVVLGRQVQRKPCQMAAFPFDPLPGSDEDSDEEDADVGQRLIAVSRRLELSVRVRV